MGVVIKLDNLIFNNKNLGYIEKQNKFIEYIQGDGNSYIDTGFTGYRNNYGDVAGTIPSDSPSIEIGFINNVKTNEENILLGTLAQIQPILYTNSGSDIYGIGKGARFESVPMNESNVVVYGSITSKLNGTTIADNSNMSNQYRLNAYPDSNMCLFVGNHSGTIKYGIHKITYFKAYQGNTLVLHLKPFIDSNGNICMKDVLSNTLYYNQGTGTFIGGSVV